MKFISSVAFVGALCTKRASSYISSIPPFGAANPNWKKTSFAQPPANIEVDDVFREEYRAWAKRYGKETNEFRFQNFKLNYMLQMQHNKKTKTFNDLNEFGDLTAKEFETGKVDDVEETTYNNSYEAEAPTATKETYNNYQTEVEPIVKKPKKEEPDNVVEVELVDSIPSVRPFGSGSIPRKAHFSDTRPTSPSNYANPENRQRPGKVNVDYTRPSSPSNYANPSGRSRPEKVNVNYTRPSGPSNYANPENRYRPEKVNVDWSPARAREQREPTYKRYQRPYDSADPNSPRVTRVDQPQPSKPRRARRYVRVGPDPII